MLMQKSRCILLCTLLFWTAAHSVSWAQFEFKIAPSVLDLTLGRGSTKVFSLEIVSDDREHAQVFCVMPMDVDVDRTGNPEFLQPGSVEFGCGNWLQAEPAEVAVGPGQAKKLICKLSIPASARAGGYMAR